MEHGVSTTQIVFHIMNIYLLAFFKNNRNWIYFIVDYRQGQLATLIVSGKWESAGNERARISLSPDGRVVAIGAGTNIYMYSTLNAELVAHIPDAHNGMQFFKHYFVNRKCKCYFFFQFQLGLFALIRPRVSY